MLKRKTPLRPKISVAKRHWRCPHCQERTTGSSHCGVRKGTKRTSLRARCDTLARTLCRLMAGGLCARCGGPGSDWAHRMPRRFLSVRWDADNCDFLCRKCHDWFGRNPFAFKDWLVVRMGSNELSALEERANQVWDKSYGRVLAQLSAALADAQQGRAA